MHQEVDAVEVEGCHESRDELLDRLAALHGVHRHVVKDAVFGEVTGEFLGSGVDHFAQNSVTSSSAERVMP